VRIVLVSANFAPHVGGVERFTEVLAGALGRRGHDVTVCCCRTEAASVHEDRGDFSIHRIRSTYVVDRQLNVPYPLPGPVDLVKTLSRATAGADVVHVQDSLYATSLPALLFARKRGIATVLTQHVSFVPQERALLDGAQRLAIATLGRCARLATAVATYNGAVAEWVRSRWGIEDVRMLPVGVETGRSERTDRTALRRSFGLSECAFLALFVGRDVPKKGLDLFLQSHDAAYELVAVTDRPSSPTASTQLAFMSPERLQSLMRCVDAFVLPSEAEGFPLSLQEALGSGLPVVTTRQPGYEDYLGPDDALFVARDARSIREALLRLAADDALCARLSERSRAVAKRHFGVERFAAAYEELYGEVVHGLNEGAPIGSDSPERRSGSGQQ
jgi:glycosyltransferase involved in cell wall biosynthesis